MMTPTDDSLRTHVHPVELLYEDHALILDKLRRAEDRIEAEKRGERAYDRDYWVDLTQFLHIYADIEHHAKEEQILFTAMQHEGVAVEGGPIGFMQAEHEEQRALVARMEESSKEGREEETRNAAHAYLQLSRQHIWKENEIVFKLAIKVLPEQVCQDIFHQFDRLEQHHRTRHSQEWLDGLLGRI